MESGVFFCKNSQRIERGFSLHLQKTKKTKKPMKSHDLRSHADWSNPIKFSEYI